MDQSQFKQIADFIWNVADDRLRDLEYVKKAEIAKLVAGLRSHADLNLPVQQEGATIDHPMKWVYQSQHRHASVELLRVVHVNVNLHRP